jgi:hypothetical protein
VPQSAHEPRSRETLIVGTLESVFGLLSELHLTPEVRELTILARGCRRRIDQWATVPPTNAQLEEMLDRVSALHEKAMMMQTGPVSAERMSAVAAIAEGSNAPRRRSLGFL